MENLLQRISGCNDERAQALARHCKEAHNQFLTENAIVQIGF